MGERKEIRLTQEQMLQAFAAENSRLEDLNLRINNLALALNELNSSIAAMDAIAKEKGKILVPLGAGVLLNAHTEDNESVLFSMAGGVLKLKKIENVKKELEKRKESIERALESVRRDQQQIAINVNALGTVLREGSRIAQQRKIR
ncbi:MAG: hypothetical protein HYW50_00685 [Candidatus Diapherotrites archaeon]|nr:hypothetical protein [Candidatus Diapherotrites archaeon]